MSHQRRRTQSRSPGHAHAGRLGVLVEPVPFAVPPQHAQSQVPPRSVRPPPYETACPSRAPLAGERQPFRLRHAARVVVKRLRPCLLQAELSVTKGRPHRNTCDGHALAMACEDCWQDSATSLPLPRMKQSKSADEEGYVFYRFTQIALGKECPSQWRHKSAIGGRQLRPTRVRKHPCRRLRRHLTPSARTAFVFAHMKRSQHTAWTHRL